MPDYSLLGSSMQLENWYFTPSQMLLDTLLETGNRCESALWCYGLLHCRGEGHSYVLRTELSTHVKFMENNSGGTINVNTPVKKRRKVR